MADKLELRIVVIDDGDKLQVAAHAIGALPPATLLQAIPAIEKGFHKLMDGMERQFIGQSMKVLFERLPPEFAAALQEKMNKCYSDGDDIKDIVAKLMDCDGECDKCTKHDKKTVPFSATMGKEWLDEGIITKPDPEKMKKYQEENR